MKAEEFGRFFVIETSFQIHAAARSVISIFCVPRVRQQLL